MSAYCHWLGQAGFKALGGWGAKILVWVTEAQGLIGEMWKTQHLTCTVCGVCTVLCALKMTSVMTLPCNAPVWFNTLDSRVFYVLEGETLSDLGMIHAHADLHWADTRQRRGRVANYLRHGPSASEAEGQH